MEIVFRALFLALTMVFPLHGAVSFDTDYGPLESMWVSGVVTNTNTIDTGNNLYAFTNVVLYTNGTFATNWTNQTARLFAWTNVLDTSTLADGTNFWFSVFATNTKGTPDTGSNNYSRFIDNHAPDLRTLNDGSWASRTNLITGTFLKTNSGISGRLVLRLLNRQSIVTQYSAAPVVSTPSNYSFTFVITNTNLANGSNEAWLIASNGAIPTVYASNLVPVYVDNGFGSVTNFSPSAWVSGPSVGISATLASNFSGFLLSGALKLGPHVAAATLADADGQGTNFNLSGTISTLGLPNGPTNLLVILTNRSVPPVPVTNFVQMKVDNGVALILTNVWPAGWKGASSAVGGVVTNTNSGILGDLVVSVSGSSSSLSLSPSGSIYNFSGMLPLGGVAPGTNGVTLSVTNGATPPVIWTTNLVFLFDDRAPPLTCRVPTAWVSGTITNDAFVVKTNSGLLGKVQAQAGTDTSALTNIPLTATNAMGASNQYSFVLATAGLANGTNFLCFSATNGSSPSNWVILTNQVLVDNAPLSVATSVSTNWLSTNLVFAGQAQSGFSGILGGLALLVSNGGGVMVSNVPLAGDGGFSITLDTNLLTNGVNVYGVEVSNQSSPTGWVRSNFIARMDTAAALPPSLSPTNWVSGPSVTVSFAVTNVRSGVRGVKIWGANQSWTPTLAATNATSNFGVTAVVNTTGFTNGPNTLWIEVTNGAMPPVVASNAFTFRVDNQAPTLSNGLETPATAWLAGTTNLMGQVTIPISGLAGVRGQVGGVFFPAVTNGTGSNFTWSINLDTSLFSNGTTNTLVVWTSNVAGALSSNNFPLKIDHFMPVATPPYLPAGWVSSNQTLSGGISQPYSGLTVSNLALSGSNLTGISWSGTGGTNQFSVPIDTVSFPNGTNWLVVSAAGAATNSSGMVMSSNWSNAVLIDNAPPVHASVFPTNWIRGLFPLVGTNTRTHSGVVGPISVLIGPTPGSAMSHGVTNITTNAANYAWATNLNASNYNNGTNFAWVTVTNGANPPVIATSNYMLRVDHEIPSILGFSVRDITRTGAVFDVAADDNGKSGVAWYLFSNATFGWTSNFPVTNTTPAANSNTFTLTGYHFSNQVQHWYLTAFDAMSNASVTSDILFEYALISNIPATNGSPWVQSAPLPVLFKEPLSPAVIYDTRNFFVSSIPGDYSNASQVKPTTLTLSPDGYMVTLTPQGEMGQGAGLYLNISTNAIATSGSKPATNLAYRFTTLPPLTASNAGDTGSTLPIKPTLRVVFSGDVDATSVNERTLWFYQTSLSTNQLHYTVSPDPLASGSNTFLLQLDDALLPLTNYTLKIFTNITGTNGSRLASNVPWSFFTEDSFQYSSTAPAPFNAALNAQPSIRFLTNIDPSSVSNQITVYAKNIDGSLTRVPGWVVVTNQAKSTKPDTVAFIPDAPLLVDTSYVATALGNIKSEDGKYFGLTVKWEFRTGAPVAAPFATAPMSNATGVSLGASILASFSNRMAIDASSVSLDSFYLYSTNDSNGSPVKVPATMTVKDSSNLLLIPFFPLDPLRTYRCVVNTAVKWADANGMGQDFAWTFTTAAALGAPGQVTPASNASFVLPSTLVTATFSESLRGDTVRANTFGVVNAATGIPVAGTVSYVDRQIVFTPRDPLTVRERYTATIQTGILSSNDAPLVSPYSWSFTVGSFVGPTGGNVSNDSGTMFLSFPPKALEKDTLVSIRNREPDAGEMASLGVPVPTGFSFEIGPGETRYLKPVAATMVFAGSGVVALENLAVYRLDGGTWSLLGGTRDGGQIAFTITGPGRYSLVANGPGSGISAPITCYPRVANQASGMHVSFSLSQAFAGRVRIYNGEGRHIRDLSDSRGLAAGDNTFFWNCKGDDGRSVAPGVYVVVVEDKNFKRVLQKVISVIRS